MQTHKPSLSPLFLSAILLRTGVSSVLGSRPTPQHTLLIFLALQLGTASGECATTSQLRWGAGSEFLCCKFKFLRGVSEFSRADSISSIFQHGLQDGYLSLNPHVKGGLFPL